MSARPYHKRYHSDALTGFMGLTLEERGAYQTLLDLIYDRQGPLIDNERLLAGYMDVSIRRWRALRETLIQKGKIYVNSDGMISNRRAEKELENDAKTTRKHAENGSKGGAKKSENLKKPNENSESALAGLEQNPSLNQSPEAIVRNNPPTPLESEPPKYAFAGKTVRLNQADFDEWRKRYHAIEDFAADLGSLDDWLQGKDQETRKRWFHVVSAALNRRHQENLAKAAQANETDDPLVRNILARQARIGMQPQGVEP